MSDELIVNVTNAYSKIFSNVLLVFMFVFAMLTTIAITNGSPTPLQSVEINLRKCNETADSPNMRSGCGILLKLVAPLVPNQKMVVLAILYVAPVMVEYSAVVICVSVSLFLYSYILALQLWLDIIISQLYLCYVAQDTKQGKAFVAIVLSFFIFDFSIFNKF